MRPRWMDYLESLEAGQELTREELIEIIDGLKGANNSLFVEACERSRKDNELRQLKIKHDALEETHSLLRAELEAAREAYTNRGTKRDCALVECDNLRAANATLRADIARLHNAIEQTKTYLRDY